MEVLFDMKDDYEVGYGKPPVETRFKPGQSGNPAGRPAAKKVSNTLRPVLKRVLDEPVSVAGKKYTPQEVMVRTLINKAMKGDLRAIKTVFELEEKFKLHQPQLGGLLVIEKVPKELREIHARMQQAKFRGEDPEGLAALDVNLPESERGRY